jgi:metallo-beta-lactamase family protein
MKVRFLGAAGTVTGSKYQIITANNNYLVDCGLFQGLKPLRNLNWQKLDLDPSLLDAVFITHAHIDHTGYLPRLIKLGFKGPIFCSLGTFELAKILLPDSGHLQEEEADYANKKGYSKHQPALPLYTKEEAEEALKYFKPVDFHKPIRVGDVQATFQRAGHILGASSILIEGQSRRICFSGDVGRFCDIIMYAPEPLPPTDYLVLESTYGDRLHSREDIKTKLAPVINDVIKNKGVVVIPAFAVGRAQHILHIVTELKKAKVIPNIPTYLDSPMAINATELYCRFNKEQRLSRKECEDMYQDSIFTPTAESSKAINDVPAPKIIISASGMASGGRVLHHLAQYIGDPKNVVILVGYQAAGTRGRSLEEGASEIKIFGKEYNVKAKIYSFSDLSAHADYQEIIQWLKNSPVGHPKVFLTHGEPEATAALKKTLENTFHWNVEIPAAGDEYDL